MSESQQEIRQMKRRLSAGLALFGLSLIVAFFSLSAAESHSESTFDLAGRSFLQAVYKVNQYYIEPPDNNRMFISALEGIAETLAKDEVEFATADLVASASPVQSGRQLYSEFIRSLRQVRSQVSRSGVKSASMGELIRSGLTQMLNDLGHSNGDQYSYYLPPQKARELTESLHNESFGGAGIMIHFLDEDNKIEVIDVLPDTPAFRAGVEPGDMIVGIDGKSLEDVPVRKAQDAQDHIRGKIGSPVVLTIEREGVPTPLDFTVIRDRIHVKNTFKVDLDEHTGYIRIDNFTQEAASEVNQYLSYFQNAGMEALVLDLRSNPGGLLDAAVKVSELFLPHDHLITYTQGRADSGGDPKYREFRVRNHRVAWNKPMAVLINKGSASASEIVTGALKDHGRATIVGTRTFGKGSVQEIFGLPDQSSLRLTVAHYYTPSGTCIHRIGIVPDVEVEFEWPEPAAEDIAEATSTAEVEEATGERELDTASSKPRRSPRRRSYFQRRREALLGDNQVQTAMDVLAQQIAVIAEGGVLPNDTSRKATVGSAKR